MSCGKACQSPVGLEVGAPAAREDFADALDFRADAAQFFFNVFVAAVDVVDAVDDGFAVGHESG